ncbi:HNH endonuclease [Pseudomonas sp. DG56-2]|uniref:HNH endonuclease n=1 Tax=Pseudomonas sp. DG56-2 TaxID=2320270 RepID=UPI00143D34E6|nr:HNH endonuclease [Pseudomonas sp. DG56-2]
MAALLDYEPATGVLTWKSPPPTHPKLLNLPAGSTTTGYVLVKIDGRKYKGHHLAWLLMHGEWPEKEIDHRNGQPMDNRIDNLRLATPAQNQANKARRTGKQFAKGVRLLPSGKFNARIKVKGVLLSLGAFPTELEASDAYMTAARHHYGEFARKD